MTVGTRLHEGVVWCPVTPAGTWLARRRGTVYFTGNSDRIYETVGRGGALVHPRVDGLDEHFAAGEHYLPYEAGSLDSVYEAVDLLLADVHLRYGLQAKGPPHVAEHHTYTHRMTEMLASLGASV